MHAFLCYEIMLLVTQYTGPCMPDIINFYGYDEQPVLSQNSINVLECQSYNSRVLAGILALQKPMEIPKTRLYIMLFWS